jgi:tetratricopeptide (TPR) repeat protein
MYTEAEIKNVKGYSTLDKCKEAILDYNKAIELLESRNNIELNALLADCYHQRGLAKSLLLNIHTLDYATENKHLADFPGAIADYNKSIELNPDSPWAYEALGLARITLGEREAGCLELRKAEKGSASARYLVQKLCTPPKPSFWKRVTQLIRGN